MKIDFTQAKRAAEIPHLVQLQAEPNKTRITICLDETIVKAYKAKAGGRGYQTLINETLRRGLEADSVKDMLREVIREELQGR